MRRQLLRCGRSSYSLWVSLAPTARTSTTAAVTALLGELDQPVASVTTLGCFLDSTQIEVAPSLRRISSNDATVPGFGRGRYAAIEMTSEALALGFARAWPCRIGVFTNLSHDHSDAHSTAEHYLASKAQLFMALPPGGTAVLNARDPSAALIAEVTGKGGGVSSAMVCLPAVSCGGKEDLAAHRITVGLDGTRFEIEASLRFPDLPHDWSIRRPSAMCLSRTPSLRWQRR